MFFSVLLVGVILINCLHQQLGHSVYMRRFAQYGTICLIKKKHEKHPWRNVTFVKLQVEACNITESSTPPSVFFTFFKFYKWYQIM